MGFLYELIRAERAAFLHVRICLHMPFAVDKAAEERKCSNTTGEEVELLNGMSLDEWIELDDADSKLFKQSTRKHGIENCDY